MNPIGNAPRRCREYTDEFDTPKGSRKVPLHSRFPSEAYLIRLGRLGYPVGAILCACRWPMLPIIDERSGSVSDFGHDKNDPERDFGSMNKKGRQRLDDPEHPYVAASPLRRTTQGDAFKPDEVSVALAAMRLALPVEGAVYEVLVKRQRPIDVAAARGLERDRVEMAVYRAKKRILREKSRKSNGLSGSEVELVTKGKGIKKHEQTRHRRDPVRDRHQQSHRVRRQRQ